MMYKLFVLLLVICSVSFIQPTDKTPRLTKLTVIPDGDPCNAPNAVFEQIYSNHKLILSFGYDDYFEKQDTVQFAYRNDSLVIKIIERNKPRIVLKNGIPDTLPGKRADPDCECNTAFKLEFQDLPREPKCIVVNNYVHDKKSGFVTASYLPGLRSKIQDIEKSKRFSLDSAFVLPAQLNTYSAADDLAWYLKRRPTLKLVVVDADTKTENELVTRVRRFFIKAEMLCPTRISPEIDRNLTDRDSTTLTVKILDTGSFPFPDYNWREH